MKSLLVAFLLSISSLTQAGDFEQFIISPYTTMGDTSNYAGIIYFEGSIAEWSDSYLCEQKRKHPNQMHMADQEGGEVVRIRGNGLVPPSPNKAKTMGLKAFKTQLNTVASNLSEKCLTTNLAPVADTNLGRDTFNRSYSDKPAIANEYAQVFATAMRNKGIAPTWKHFPGYSNDLRNMTNLDYKFIKYYKPGYKEGLIDSSSIEDIEFNMTAFKNDHADIVMLNYGVFENISDQPILFNQKIVDKAREYQPNSLIMSDDIAYLKLNDEKVIYLFKNIDLFLFTDYRDTVIFINKLNQLKTKGLITQELLQSKINRIKQWKNKQK